MITYKTFDSPIEAHMIKSKLESFEIDSFVFDENLITLNQFYNLAAGGIKLKIRERDIDRANTILQVEIDGVEDDSSAIKCPECGSGNVAFGPATKNKYSIFSLILSLLIFVYPFQANYRYHCFNCEHEFKPN